MRKRNYVKPSIETFAIKTQGCIAGSTGGGYTTEDTTIAVDMIESCFKVEQGSSSTITDSELEAWLVKGNSFIAKADNKGEANSVSATTCQGYFTTNNCYKIEYNGSTWKFTPATCSFSGKNDVVDLTQLSGWGE